MNKPKTRNIAISTTSFLSSLRTQANDEMIESRGTEQGPVIKVGVSKGPD